jgi:TatD DNase family protein
MTVEALPLADTHCHLVLPEFSADCSAVLQRSRDAGVERLLVPGTDLASSREAVRLAEAHGDIYAAVGVHPHSAREWSEACAQGLRDLVQSGRVVAIGEIGLDYYRDRSPRPQQREAFRAQLDLAAEAGLPVVVHNRQATQDLLGDLLPWAQGLGRRLGDRAGVLHAFSAELADAQTAIAAGFYVGVAGPVTYPNAAGRRALVARLPIDRLVIETDSPYLPPQAHRGERNEPAFVRLVAGALSETLNLPIEVVAQATTANAAVLFGWNHGNNHGRLF